MFSLLLCAVAASWGESSLQTSPAQAGEGQAPGSERLRNSRWPQRNYLDAPLWHSVLSNAFSLEGESWKAFKANFLISYTGEGHILVLFAFFPSVISYVPCRSQEPWISVLEWLLISPGFICQLPSSSHVGPSVAPHTSCPWIFAQAVPLTPNASTLPPITWLPLLHISLHASPPQEGLPARPLTVPQTGPP